MEQQQYMMKMQMLGQEAEKLEQQLQMIDQQSSDLNAVLESVQVIKEGKSKELLANLGKGIFVRADLKEKDLENLLQNSKKDTIVKKPPEQTIQVIEDQLGKLAAGKEQFVDRIAELQNEMQNLLLQVQREQSGHKHSSACEHEDCECETPCEDCECEHEHKEEKKKAKKK